MKALVDGLTEMKDLLSEKIRWTKGAKARNSCGRSEVPVSEDAVCWCLLGAIHRVADDDHKLYRYIYDRLEEQIIKRHKFKNKNYVCNFIASYNDHPNIRHHHVMNMIQKTIDAEVDVASWTI